MSQFEEYKKKYGHLDADEKEMRRKYYTYLQEQQMLLELAGGANAQGAAGSGPGGPSPKDRRPVPDFNVNPFTSTWKTDNAGASSLNQIQIPTIPNGNYYFKITWGDGNEDIITDWDQKELRHTYATEGTYEVSIFGIFEGFNFNASNANGGDRLKILDISQWGDSFTLQSNAFNTCSNLNITAADAPSDVESLSATFANCSSLTDIPGMTTWDISKITNLNSTFSGCTSLTTFPGIVNLDTSRITSLGGTFAFSANFNADISGWDISSCTNLGSMFQGATSFNQPIGTWNTGNVTVMNFMFTGANSFNQNIGAWDTGNVTRMAAMFNPTTSFNNGGSPDINNWNVSKVLDFNIMFRSASAFNQPIGNWDVSSTLSLRSMFRDSGFRQNLDNWRPVNCINFTDIFLNLGGFNPNVPNWTVSKGQSFSRIFQSTAANFSLAAWDVSGAFNLDLGGQFSSTNYSAGLIAWAALPSLQRNVFLRVGGQYTSAAASARAYLISEYNWTIVDSGLAP